MSYTDWIELVEKTIPYKKRLSILEFGLGKGTQYLLDNFKHVYSYELAARSRWYDRIVQKYSKYNNWDHKLILFGDIGFVDYDPNLPQTLLDDISDLFKEYDFDVVLMDGDYHVRGDIVDFILKRFSPKYVIIHDINLAFEIDGYDRINLSKNYKTLSLYIGEGTRIFIRKRKSRSPRRS